MVNPHLLRDLLARDLWTEEMRQQLIAHNGSVQNIDAVPDDLKALYKTVWEIKQRCILDLAIDRSPYIDQSHSLNIHMVNPTYAKLSTMHFYGWRGGLKTGLYYLRTQAAADAIKFTVDSQIASSAAKAKSLNNPTFPAASSSSSSPATTSNSLSHLGTTTDSSSSVTDEKNTTTSSPGEGSAEMKMAQEEQDKENVNQENREGMTVMSAAPVCRWRRKDAPADEHCEMCSG